MVNGSKSTAQCIVRTGDRVNWKNQQHIVHYVVSKSGEIVFESVVRRAKAIIINQNMKSMTVDIGEVELIKGEEQ